jgi:hypothetical protein
MENGRGINKGARVAIEGHGIQSAAKGSTAFESKHE